MRSLGVRHASMYHGWLLWLFWMGGMLVRSGLDVRRVGRVVGRWVGRALGVGQASMPSMSPRGMVGMLHCRVVMRRGALWDGGG